MHNQLKIGVILNYAIIFLNAIVGLLYTPYMLRMMGQSEYGLYSLVASVIAYLTILDLGLGNAVVRYTAKYRAENKTTEQCQLFGMVFVLYLIIGVIAIIVGSIFYYNIDALFDSTMTTLEIGKAKVLMVILIFNLAITFPMSIFSSILTAYEEFVFPRAINVCRIILNTVVMVFLLKLGYKAISMAIVQTIFNVISLLLNYIYCKRKIHIKMYFNKMDWGLLKEIAIYSFWIFLNVIMDKVYWSTGQFVLGTTEGTVAISVFSVAILLTGMYMQFSSAISSLFLPKVTELVTNGNNESIISDLFIKTGRLQFHIMAFILSGFIVFGQSFIELWAGEGYGDAYIITLLFFASLLIPLIQNLGITVLQARNQMKFRSILYIIIAIVSLVLQFVFAHKWGAIGCAIAVAGALFVGQGILMNIYYQKKQGIDIIRFWKEILKIAVVPMLISVLSTAIINFYQKSILYLALSIVIFCAVYLILTYLVSLNSYEKSLTSNFIKKTLRIR